MNGRRPPARAPLHTGSHIVMNVRFSAIAAVCALLVGIIGTARTSVGSREKPVQSFDPERTREQFGTRFHLTRFRAYGHEALDRLFVGPHGRYRL